MTKYEWESELKKNIHRLPDAEIKRVLEYYDELFADKIERGYGECEIISQFGNPVDVADKILADYDGELREDEVVPPPTEIRRASETPHTEERSYERRQEPQPEKVATLEPSAPTCTPIASAPTQSAKTAKRKFHSDRLLLFVILNVVFGFLPFIAVATVWIIDAAMVVSSVAIALGGAAGTVVAATQLVSGVGAAIAQIGMGTVLVGVGILMTIGFVKLTVLLAKGTVKLCKFTYDWIYPREEAVA